MTDTTLFNFLHISDTQLLPQGECCYGIDPCDRLRRCIADILKYSASAEVCIMTGDLTHRGDESAYRLLKKELSTLNLPVWLLPGNHDITQTFCRVFGSHLMNEKGYVQFSHATPAGRLIGLDTHREGMRAGRLCSWQLAWLEDQLREAESVFLFMHHPPFPLGLPSMDDDNLLNGGELLQVIQRNPGKVRHLFFGHVHRSVSGSWHGISYSCPFSLVHQTPFDFSTRKVTALSAESPQYHQVHIHADRVIVHARDFLNSAPLLVTNC